MNIHYFKSAVFFLFCLLMLYSCKTKKTVTVIKKSLITVGFYNVENLFDTIDSKSTIDEAFLPSSEKKWTSNRYQKKLEALSEVISQMGNSGSGPEILGLSEIENLQVLEDLVKMPKLAKQNYQIIHYNSLDARGIDVALLFNPKHFQALESRNIPLFNPKDTAFRSRDLLFTKGKLDGEIVFLMVAHWPSRRGGEEKTRELRINAANAARFMFDSLFSLNPNCKVLMMGDFNDDPADQSIKKHLKTTGNKNQVSTEQLFNPMDSLHRSGVGTLEWRGKWNLFDQIILSPGFIKAKISYHFAGAYIFDKYFLRVQTGKYKGNPYRTYAGPKYLGGYSDHFPVYIQLSK